MYGEIKLLVWGLFVNWGFKHRGKDREDMRERESEGFEMNCFRFIYRPHSDGEDSYYICGGKLIYARVDFSAKMS